MEEKSPVTFEEIPQDQKPKSNSLSKILLVVILALIGVARCSLKNPEGFKAIRSIKYMVEVKRLLQDMTTDEDTTHLGEIIHLCDKTLAMDKDIWQAWYIKGSMMEIRACHDSASLCMHEALQRMGDDEDADRKKNVRVICVEVFLANHEIEDALHQAHLNAKDNSDDVEVRKQLQSCCRKYYRLVLGQDTLQPMDLTPWEQAQKLIDLANALHQDKLWIEAVWVAKQGRKAFPDDRDMFDTLKTIGCAYCDDLLAHSNNAKEMWNLSRTLWNIDRKRALNLRRKCAKQGDQFARDWFKKKGYDWD